MTDKPSDSIHADPFKKHPKELIQGQLSLGKLIFLGVVAIVLSMFGPLSLLAPVPLAVAFLLYGKEKAGLLGLGLSGLLWGVTLGLGLFSELSVGAFIFSFALAYAYLTFRAVEKGEHPVKGLMRSGAVVLGFWLTLILGASLVTGFQLQSTIVEVAQSRVEMFKTDARYATQFQAIKNSATPEAKLLLDSLNKPEELVNSFLKWAPGAIVVGTFFTLWICQFMVLRNSLIWRQLWNYPYGLADLMRFKMPDLFVLPVILGLALVLGSEMINFPMGEVIGGNLLLGLAVFYFFQGFGIVMDGLTYLKIGGLMRSLAMVLIMFLAWRVVIFVGLFDTWINFRKYMNKNIDEGENS